MFFAAITKLPFCTTITSLYRNLCCCTCICMFITISICISICRTCLVLSVVVPVHFICFTVGEWETFLSIPCMSDVQEIDNKATLTLTCSRTRTHTLCVNQMKCVCVSVCVCVCVRE